MHGCYDGMHLGLFQAVVFLLGEITNLKSPYSRLI